MQFFLCIFCCFALYSCNGATKSPTNERGKKIMDATIQTSDSIAYATFGAGCFWCVEAVFQDLHGVILVESGYMGGTLKDPTYKQVCSGSTGHAEVCRITFDPRKITFKELLEVFWQTHDPTTLNMQGNDIGTQYRSAIFYYDEYQKKESEFYKQELENAHIFSNPIVTTFEPASRFYKAEDYHQNYYSQNEDQPYCAFVIKPKVEKFRKIFSKKLKP